MPPLRKRAWAFLKAKLRDLVLGRPRVDLATHGARLAHCFACDRLTRGHCGECGCPVATKAYHGGESCPLGRWDGPAPPPFAARCGCGG